MAPDALWPGLGTVVRSAIACGSQGVQAMEQIRMRAHGSTQRVVVVPACRDQRQDEERPQASPPVLLGVLHLAAPDRRQGLRQWRREADVRCRIVHLLPTEAHVPVEVMEQRRLRPDIRIVQDVQDSLDRPLGLHEHVVPLVGRRVVDGGFQQRPLHGDQPLADRLILADPQCQPLLDLPGSLLLQLPKRGSARVGAHQGRKP